MWVFVLLCTIPAWAVSFLATAALRRWAPRWGLIDRPGQRRVHHRPTPLGGGIAIWLGVVAPLAAVQFCAWWLLQRSQLPDWLPQTLAPHLEGVVYRSGQMWAILAGGTLLAALGLLDDLRGLPWWPRLVVQAGVAGGLVAGGIQATVFLPAPWLAAVATILWIMVLVNAFNFLDNMDGLSSGMGLIAAALFAFVMLHSVEEPRWLVGGTALVLAGALAGFLCHNWSPARIFMGDAGSYFIGLMLGTIVIVGTFYEHGEAPSRHVILAPLCILAVPLYDFSSVVLIRLREGRSPFLPDKSHFSHRLVERGLKPPHAVLTIHLATLTTGLGALLLYEVPGWSGALVVVALVACVLMIVAILEMAGRNGRGETRGPTEG